MQTFFQPLLNNNRYIPHGHCYLWQPGLVGLHLISDILIAIAYYSIPLALIYFVRKRRDMPFNGMFLLFSAFIIACGTTHLLEVWTLWHPAYWLSGLAKAITAFVSVYTAVTLISLLPQFLTLPSLAATNQKLEEEIAERRKAETALQQSEATLRLFAKFAPAGIAMFDRTMHYVMASQRWIEDYHLESVEALLGRSHYEIFPNIPERWRQIHQRCLAGAIEYCEEDLFERTNGSQQWLCWEVRPWYTTDQEIGGIIIFAEDITKRKQAEANLRESEERLRLALMSTNQGLYDVNIKTGEVIVNSTYATMLEYDPDTFQETANRWMQRLHPEDREQALQLYQAYVTGEIPEYSVEFRLQTQSGGWKWISSLGKIVAWDADGNPLRMLGTHTDISDRKQAESEKLQTEKLRMELQLLENILEVSLAGYWDWDIPGNQEYLSPTLKRMFGYEDHELPNTPETLKHLICSEDLSGMLDCFDQHVKSRGQIPYYNEVRYRHKTGSTIWVICSGRVIEWGANGEPLRMVGCHINITERKQVEQSLKISEARYRAIVEDQTELIVRFSPDATMLFVNEAYCRYFGLRPEEVIGKSYEPIIFEADREAVNQSVQSMSADNPTVTIENRVIINGEIRWTQWINRMLFDKQGQFVEFQSVGRDITDRKQAEAALRESERRFATLAAAAPVAIFRFDEKGECIYVNDRWSEMTGRPLEAAMGLGWVETVHPEDRDQTALKWNQWSQAKKPAEFFRHEARLLRPDGSILWYYCLMLPELDSNGVAIGYIGTLTDITDRKQTEEALATYAHEVEDLYNNAPCGYHSLDPEGRYISINETELQWLGYSREEMIGQSLLNFFTQSSQAQFLQNYSVFKERGWAKDLEYDMICKDGSILPVLVNATAVKDSEGTYLYNRATLFDNRDRKQAETQLRLSSDRLSLANAELARAARLKDEFLASMSHELRTPLNAILGLSEALLEEVCGTLNDQQRRTLQTIERSGQHLLELINDILDLSKIESGKMELDVTAVSVQYLCDSSLAFVKQQANHKQIKLSCQIAEPLTQVEVDERRIRQVLVNLLSNAVKFTCEGGSVQLQVAINPLQESVEFSVIDTGIGIAANQFNKLFQPFVQLDSSLSRRYEGTGLGLALVQRIVELHNGSVSLESQVGQGSRFTVALPWQFSCSGPIPKNGAGKSTIPDHLQALIVEDSETAATQLSRYLTELGVKAIVQSQGEGVLAKAIRLQPDVIILDILLPDRSGWEVLTALKVNAATQNIPVIVVSVIDERSHGLQLGASECLVKPITRQQLQQAISQVLEPTNQSELNTALVVSGQPSVAPLVLLAEDNEANITTLGLYLKAHGWQVIVARNGLEAVQMTKQYQPDVVAMDIQMPEMDGLEATRQIRSDAETSHVPIVALTALAMPGDRERCLAAGADHYLTKPVSLKQLLKLLSTYINRQDS